MHRYKLIEMGFAKQRMESEDFVHKTVMYCSITVSSGRFLKITFQNYCVSLFQSPSVGLVKKPQGSDVLLIS